MLADRLTIVFRIGLPMLLTWWVASAVAARANLLWGLTIPFLPLVGVGIYQKMLQRRGDVFEDPTREEWLGGIIFGAGLAFLLTLGVGVVRWLF